MSRNISLLRCTYKSINKIPSQITSILMRVLRNRRIIIAHILAITPFIRRNTRYPDVSAAERRIWNRIGNTCIRSRHIELPVRDRTKAKDADEARILSSNESRRATLSRGITLGNAAPSISLALPSQRRFLSKAPITRLNAPSSPCSLLHTYYASFVCDRHATPPSLDGGIYDGIGKRRLRILLTSRHHRRIEPSIRVRYTWNKDKARKSARLHQLFLFIQYLIYLIFTRYFHNDDYFASCICKWKY